MPRLRIAGALVFQLMSFAVAAQDMDALPHLQETYAIDSSSVSSPSWYAKYQSLLRQGKKGKFILGYTKAGLPVEAWYFPGTTNKRALIIGGMHGSELSSVDVAQMVITQLDAADASQYHVIVIPKLFPDNISRATHAHSTSNIGRYSSANHPDPNRQMPPLGKSFDPQFPFDALGRPIEKENCLLLDLIQHFRPERIANLHAIRDASRAGVYADPRTDCNGIALGFQQDSVVAVTMAKFIGENGGLVPGNQLQTLPTALYYKDPVAVREGNIQKRNLKGSVLPNNRGGGVSLGSWATTQVCEGANTRDAMMLITVEFPGYHSYKQCRDKEKTTRFMNVYLYATAVTRIFLGE